MGHDSDGYNISGTQISFIGPHSSLNILIGAFIYSMLVMYKDSFYLGNMETFRIYFYIWYPPYSCIKSQQTSKLKKPNLL